MNCMFWGCEKFDQDLSKWDDYSVTDTDCMFSDCKNLNQYISTRIRRKYISIRINIIIGIPIIIKLGIFVNKMFFLTSKK